MSGIEYMNNVCPTTKEGKDPNREDVADAFEDGIAEGFKQCLQQLTMKAVVLETRVVKDSDGDGIETPYEEWLALEDNEVLSIPDNIGLKDGDKVKLIIVKED